MTNGIFNSSTAGTPAVDATGANGAGGIAAFSDTGVGVYGESTGYDGMAAISHSSQHAAVSATNSGGGYGVWVEVKGDGQDTVRAISHSSQHAAVSAINDGGGDCMYAESHSSQHAAVSAINVGSGGYAGYFQGNVAVTGDVILTGADCNWT
jgi:hypothetical protein